MPDVIPSEEALLPDTPDLVIKRHDTGEPFTAVLSDADGPIDLTDIPVKFIMKGLHTGPLVTGVCVADPDQVTNRGKLTYQPVDPDTAVSDVYAVEFELTLPDGPKTIPSGAYRRIDILPDLEDT